MTISILFFPKTHEKILFLSCYKTYLSTPDNPVSGTDHKTGVWYKPSSSPQDITPTPLSQFPIFTEKTSKRLCLGIQESL